MNPDARRRRPRIWSVHRPSRVAMSQDRHSQSTAEPPGRLNPERLVDSLSLGPRWARCGVALGLVVADFGLRRLLMPLSSPNLRLVTVLPAVVLAAWLGGFDAALVATAASTLIAAHWLPPEGSLRVDDPHEVAALFVFAAVAVLIALVIDRLHRTRRRLEEQSAGLARETAARARSEERLRALAIERAGLADAEREARAAAETANRAKDEFLVTLAHELRNPLSAITMAARLLEEAGESTGSASRYRDVISRQAGQIGRIVDDLLDAGRIMSGKIVIHRHRVALDDVVRCTVTTLQTAGRLTQHAIELQLEPVWVEADPARMEQVVVNLLGNAVKYTPAGGAVEVSLRRHAAEAVLLVRDNGVGMPPDLVPRVFDLFVQGGRGGENGPVGLGIGLALVRRIIELHGGAIAAASPGAGQGSTFTVRLPACDATAAEAPDAARRSVPLGAS